MNAVKLSACTVGCLGQVRARVILHALPFPFERNVFFSLQRQIDNEPAIGGGCIHRLSVALLRVGS
jgi:hypothetical protein